MTETLWHDATIRQLEVIGEATKNLSPDLRDQYPDVPWRRIAGMQDVLIHNYMGVNLKAVREITRSSLPGLKTSVERILKELPE